MTARAQDQSPEDSLFAHAIAKVLKHEGGSANDPDDPGGATKFGVSLRLARSLGDLDRDGLPDLDLDLDGDVDEADIFKLSRDDAALFYRAYFWDNHGYGQMPPHLAVKLFDLAVNMGPGQAHRCLQRALRACGMGVAEDGVLGPWTLKAVKAVDEIELLAALRAEAAGFYRLLAALRPASKKHLAGWLNRAYD